MTDTSKNTNLQRTITFQCHACDAEQKIALAQAGRETTCEQCDTKLRVPIKIGLGREQKPEALRSKEIKEPKANMDAPREKTETLSNKAHEGHKAATDNVGQPIKPRDRTGLQILLLVLSAGVIVGLYKFGSPLLQSLQEGETQPLAAMTVPQQSTTSTPAENNPPASTAAPALSTEIADVEDILGFWKSARMAEDRIENDLNVSITEMKANGMVDEARILEKSRAQANEKIDELRTRHLIKMKRFASDYATNPDGVIALFEELKGSRLVRDNPRSTDFLDRVLESLKALPADPILHEEHFNKIFD